MTSLVLSLLHVSFLLVGLYCQGARAWFSLGLWHPSVILAGLVTACTQEAEEYILPCLGIRLLKYFYEAKHKIPVVLGSD